MHCLSLLLILASSPPLEAEISWIKFELVAMFALLADAELFVLVELAS